MRIVKIVAFSLLGLVALLLLAIAAIVILVDPNDYKDEIAQAVKQHTGRELKLAGDLGLSFYPWLAIKVRKAELGNRAGFGAEPFAAIDAADVGVRLWPLLHRQLEVGRVSLEGLHLNLRVDAQGRSNWEDLGGGETSTAGAQSTESGPAPQASIAGLSIKDSQLDYQDAQAGSHTRIEGLQLETGRLSPGEPTSLVLAFKYSSGAGSGPPLPVKLRIPALTLDLEAESVQAPQFDLYVDPAHISGQLDGRDILKSPVLEGRIALDEVSLRELMKTFGVTPPRTRDANVLQKLSLQSAVRADSKSAALSDVKLKLDDTQMNGRLSVADFKTTALRFDLKVDRLDLDRYLPPEEKAAKPARETPSEPIVLPVDMLKTLNAQGTLDIAALTAAGIKFTAVKVKVDAQDGQVRIDPSQAQIYSGTHRGKVIIDARGATPQVSVEEQLSGIEFAPLMQQLFDSKRISGKGNANLSLVAHGADSNAWLKTLDGRMDFSLVDGALEGIDLGYEISRARALLKREAGSTAANAGRTAFKTLKTSATVEDGTMRSRDLDVDAQYLKIGGEGTLKLATQAVDYLLKATVAPESKEGAALQDLKSVQIPIRVTGTLQDLKVRPDLEGVIKAQAQKKIDEKKEEVKEKVQDELKKWLGGKKK